MKGYQAGIAQFVDSGAVVFGVSTDPLDRNREFAESLGLDFALLSDVDGAVAKKYGVLVESARIASRATFVVDKKGEIAFIEEGMGALDPAGAAGACGQLH